MPLVLSLHRVAPGDDVGSAPFSRLATIATDELRAFLEAKTARGAIVALDDALRGPDDDRPRIALTFDDVSRTVLTEALPLLKRFDAPATLFANAGTTDRGSSWRDLVYFVLESPELVAAFTDIARDVFGEAATAELRPDTLYAWSKSPEIDQARLLEEVLPAAIGDRRDEFDELVRRERPYLDWDELAELAAHPLLRVESHGYEHFDLRTLTSERIRADILATHERVASRLGIDCRAYAPPFGLGDERVRGVVDSVCRDLEYESVLWVGGAKDVRDGNPDPNRAPAHITRLHVRDHLI